MADSDLSEDEQLRLLFREGGIDVVTDAKDSFKNLTEEMQGTAQAADAVAESTQAVDTITAQAIEVLKSQSTIVEDLKEKIRKLKAEHEDLNDAMKAGLVPQGKYKEQSDALLRSISENETVLKRLTAAETEKKRIDEEAEAALKKVTAALDEETAAAQRLEAATAAATAATKAEVRAEAFRTVARAAEMATGTGEGEEGQGGLAGLAAGMMKVERAGLALASGHGLARAGGLMESLALAAGGPAGLGLALGGIAMTIEVVLPKLQALRDTMIGITDSTRAATTALKEHEEQARKNAEAIAKMAGKPTAEQEAIRKSIVDMTSGAAAGQVQYGITQGWRSRARGPRRRGRRRRSSRPTRTSWATSIRQAYRRP